MSSRSHVRGDVVALADDPLRTRLEARGSAERGHGAGFQDDMPVWMNAKDVILLASADFEPFGWVIVEGAKGKRRHVW